MFDGSGTSAVLRDQRPEGTDSSSEDAPALADVPEDGVAARVAPTARLIGYRKAKRKESIGLTMNFKLFDKGPRGHTERDFTPTLCHGLGLPRGRVGPHGHVESGLLHETTC